MSIQWFPGHMTLARKQAAQAMADSDVLVEVLDARLPAASSNPMIQALRKHRSRPCLKLLNKSDLADPVITQAWLDHFATQPGVAAVALSCKRPAEVTRVTTCAQALAPHRNDNLKPLRMLVMGIPNVGKSTLINALLRRRAAKVGDEPAITKTTQRYELSPRVSLIDTPGLMWPKIEHDSDGYLLAASHAIGRNAVIDEQVASFLADILLARYPALLAGRYRCDVNGIDGTTLIEAIARGRGYRRKGGGADIEKAAGALLQDYRDGMLGRISLETPDSRRAMLAASSAETRAAAAD